MSSNWPDTGRDWWQLHLQTSIFPERKNSPCKARRTKGRSGTCRIATPRGGGWGWGGSRTGFTRIHQERGESFICFAQTLYPYGALWSLCCLQAGLGRATFPSPGVFVVVLATGKCQSGVKMNWLITGCGNTVVDINTARLRRARNVNKQSKSGLDRSSNVCSLLVRKP